MGLERYQEAIECFRRVLSQPTGMVHQVHMDAYVRITLLHLIVHGQSFNAKKAGVGTVVQRKIEQEENRRMQEDGMSGLQDGAWMEESGIMLANENPNKWHCDLINAWETNNVEKMDEAIAGNYEQLQEEQMVGTARLML